MGYQDATVTKEQFDQIVDQIKDQKIYWYLNDKIKEIERNILRKLWEWLEKFIVSKYTKVTGSTQIPTWLLISIKVILILLAVVILAILVFYIYKMFNKYKPGVGEILGEKITKDTTPISLLEKGRAFEKQNDYRMGLRYSYIATILLMHEQGVIYVQDSYTNQEIYECLKQNKDISIYHFVSMMTSFNSTWYGRHELNQTEYEKYMEEQKSLWDEVMRCGQTKQ